MKKLFKYINLFRPLGIILVVPAIAWFFGFQGTISRWQAYQTQQQLLENLQQNQQQRETPTHKTTLSTVPVLRDGSLLKELTPITSQEKITVIKYTPQLLLSGGNVQLDAGEAVLQGNFVSLVKVLDFLENNPNLGKIAGVAYHTILNQVTKKRQLNMTLWILQLHENDRA